MKIRNSGKLVGVFLSAGAMLAGCNSDLRSGVVPPVDLAVVVTGEGSVISDQGGINCSEGGVGTCAVTLPAGTTVTLTADASDVFNRLRTWAGSCTGSTGGTTSTCTVTLDTTKQVVAVFEPTTAPPVADVLALADGSPQRLLSFDDSDPATILTDVAVSGLQAGDQLVGIDFRPANGLLYGVAKGTSSDRLYLIDEQTGVATAIAALFKDPVDTSAPYSRLGGAAFGLDVDPLSDRLRVVSSTRENLRVNLDTGSVITEALVTAASGVPSVTASAYTFSFPGATTTTLFGIDTATDMLVTQNRSTGALTNVGALGVDTSDVSGFDIVGTNIRAFAALIVSNESRFYSLDLTTGAVTNVGVVGTSADILGLAMPISATPPAVGDTVVLSATNKLASFNLATPVAERTLVQVTGLQAAGEKLLGIDFSAGSGNLYGLSDASKLYTINPATGVATFRSTLNPVLDSNATSFAVDFDPTTTVPGSTAERLRIVANTGQNLFIDVATGQNATGQTAVEARYQATAGAYSNAFKGARSSALYVLARDTDAVADKDRLFTQNPAGGTLAEIGSLGLTGFELAGFDIDGKTGVAVAVLNGADDAPQLRTVNLENGEMGAPIPFAVTEEIRGLALRTPGEPEVFAVCVDDIKPICAPGLTLIRFAPSAPEVYTKIGDISGLGAGEVVVGLDFRPLTGDLVALSSGGKLYTVNTATAAATALPVLVAAAGDDLPFVSLDPDVLYGMDFNPVTDRLRIVGANNVNLRVAPDSGEVTTDADLQRTPFQITGLAYANNSSGVTSTVLYGIDTENDRLFTVANDNQSLGNAIKQVPSGSLGVDADEVSGFEIVSGTSTAYAAFSVGSSSNLYTVNLNTGRASQVGTDSIGKDNGLGEVADITAPIGQANPEIFAVTAGASPRLVSFAQADPSSLTSNRAITGLVVASEQALGLDFRAFNGSLYLLTSDGSSARLYTLNLTTALATLVGALAADPLDMSSPYSELDGSSFGMDFDPVNGRLRISSDTGQNLTVNLGPPAIFVTTNSNLAHTPTPVVHAAAYTRNFTGASSTQLLVWDAAGVNASNSNNDKLMDMVEQPTDDIGYLNDIGNTGVNSNVDNPVSLDIIGGHDGLTLATLMVGTSTYSSLYSINRITGSAELLGEVGQITGTPFIDDKDTHVAVQAMAVRFPPQ